MLFPPGVVCQSPMICCELSATHHISSRCRSVAHHNGAAQCRLPYLEGDHFKCSEGAAFPIHSGSYRTQSRAQQYMHFTRSTVYRVPRHYAWRLLHNTQHTTPHHQSFDKSNFECAGVLYYLQGQLLQATWSQPHAYVRPARIASKCWLILPSSLH